MGKQAALDKQASIGKRLHWAARRGPAAVASDAPLSVVLAAHPRLAKLKARLPLPLRPIAQVGVAYKAPDGTLLPSVPEDLDLLEQCEVGAAHGAGCVSAHCKSAHTFTRRGLPRCLYGPKGHVALGCWPAASRLLCSGTLMDCTGSR